MNSIDSRKVIMTMGGILIATLVAGCFGGGPGYWNRSNGYNSSYSSYGSSYPYRGDDQHAVETRDRAVAPAETQHSSVDRDKISLR